MDITPNVSIIIPTYNEAADIRETLNALVALDYEQFEVLVVDASQDATPQIVSSFASEKVRLVLQSRGQGRAAARNEGILAAQGEIVVILNADVQLPSDFIKRLVPHYAAGADYVLVESRVSNSEAVTARYVQALHEFHYPARPEVEAWMNWTEGFSCRRAAAIAAGLFPEVESVALVSGEDGWFGERLAAAGYRKAFDHSICVMHVAPADLPGFWHQRVERGNGVPQVWYERDKWTMRKITLTVLWLSLLSGIAMLVPWPALYRGWRLSSYTAQNHRDWPIFFVLGWIETAANIYGLAKGTLELYRAGAR